MRANKRKYLIFTLLMETLINQLDYNNDKRLYGQLYKIRSEYIKNEKAIVS